MSCSHCFHNAVCGNSSVYNDASQCKTFVDKDSVVSIDILHKVQHTCEQLKADCRSLMYDNEDLHERIRAGEDELRHLRTIKQTLEMCSGRKFDY